jgi:hypothetical protein
VTRGERIGLVRFGSRVDLWVPRDAEILVSLGENVKGGSSVVARWLGKPQGKNVNEGTMTDAKVSLAGRR